MGLLTPLDIVIFLGSLIAVMGLGLWAGRKEDTSSDYFLAGRRARWWGVAGSIFGSNVSANHIIGMMGVGFTFGFAQSHFEISAIFGLLLLCYGFLPVYRKLGVYTLSEYLSRRYDDANRVAYAVIMLAVIVVIQMVPGFYIGSRSLNILIREGENAKAGARVNETGEVTAIEVLEPGRQYASAPNVEIAPPPDGEDTRHAVAEATIDPESGTLSRIEVTAGGAGYDPEAPPRVRLHGGASFGKHLDPADVNPRWYVVGILLMAVVTGTYTIIGGLKAVIVTDVIQSILMLAAALIVGFLTFGQSEIGGAQSLAGVIDGWRGMLQMDSAEDGRELMSLYLPADHPRLPWTGVLSGLMVLHFYYWGTNQFIVQRALAAHDGRQARLGIIAAGFFKLLIPFMSIGAGIAAYYIFRQRGMLGTVDQDAAFTELMNLVVSPLGFGLVGLVSAGVVGAILSSIDSMMNSAATIITFDFYRRYIKPDASERHLIFVGRVFIAVFLMVAASLCIFTSDPNSKSSFFLQIASHQSKLIAGVVVAFALGMFWKRATAAGALAAIVGGVVFSYGLPVLYANYIGARTVERVSGTEITTAGPHNYQAGAAVRWHATGALPAAKPPLAEEQMLFVGPTSETSLSLYRTQQEAQPALQTSLSPPGEGRGEGAQQERRREGAQENRTLKDAPRESNAVRYVTRGSGTLRLYNPQHASLVAALGSELAFMHAVFLAAVAAVLIHVGISLLTQPPTEEKSQLTWTLLGGHDPNALRHVLLGLAATLLLSVLLAVGMVSERVSPLAAGLIAGGFVWILFIRAALTAVKEGRAGADSPETAGEFATSLLLEDRFWAGLLCGIAVLMLFYFY